MRRVFLLFLGLMCGCNQKQIDYVPQKIQLTADAKMQEMFKEYVEKDNEREFEKLCGDAILSYSMETLLYYSILMANKNDSPSAYFYTYMALTNADSSLLKSKDIKTQNFALYNLIKSDELGYENAEMEIRLYFGKGKSHPNSKYFLMKYLNK